MLLVDEIDIDEAGVCHAKYRIREDEFFCRGHFPGNPIVPGVIQCEIMAQSCALLVKDEIQGKTTLYSGIDNVREAYCTQGHAVLLRGFCVCSRQAVLQRQPFIRIG